MKQKAKTQQSSLKFNVCQAIIPSSGVCLTVGSCALSGVDVAFLCRLAAPEHRAAHRLIDLEISPSQ